MRRTHTLTRIVRALACMISAGVAADAPEPAPPAPAANVRIRIQDGAQLQLNAGGVRVQAAAGASAAAQSGQPPVIFIPGFPFHPLPNFAAIANAKPGYLGVVLDTNPDAQENGEGKKNGGVGVLTVVEDSPAAAAGLQEGDRVLTFDGKKATDSTQLREMIRATQPDTAVKLTVRRDGKDVELKAKLAAAPEAPAAVQMIGQIVPEAVPGVVTFPAGAGRGIISTLKGSTIIDGKIVMNFSRVYGAKNAPDDMDFVTLRDGNRFAGKITGIAPAKGVTMQREGFPDMDLIAEEISALTFAEREKIEAAPAKVHLQLRDGSWFGGDALTMENGTLLLTLPGGQRIEIPREHAQSATLSTEQAPQIYDGPTGIAGWSAGRANQGQWEYKDGFLGCISNGPIARNFERMPDPLDLSFDVVFPPRLHHFGVTLFGAGVNQSGAGALTIQFSPNQISGHHYDGRRSNQYSVQLQPDADVGFSEKAKAVRYRLLVDRVNGRVLICVAGIKRAEWKLSKVNAEDIGKCGATFSFSPNVFSSNDQVRLGRIRLLPWDGKEPADGAEPAMAKADQILAGDGKVMDGTIEKITDGEIVIANPQGVTRRDRTLYVRFAAPVAPKEQPAAVAVLRLKNGSEFAVTEIKGGGDTTTLTTRFGPQITLPLSSLREMNFLPRPGQSDPVTKGADLLTFTDGTQLKGRVIAPFEGDKLRWKIAASKTPLEFSGPRVAGIFFSRAKDEKESPALKGASIVRFGNGDWLPGDVVSLDEKQLVMRTDLTPQIIVPLSELRGLYLSPDVAACVSDGATGRGQWMDGWNPNRAYTSGRQTKAAAETEQPWMYHDGGYELTGANRNGSALLARKWPAYAGAFAVNLEIANPGRSGSFNIQLFNSKDERTFTIYCMGGRVNVYFNPSNVRLNRFAGVAKRFETDIKMGIENANIRAGIVLDRPAKTFRVFMAGKEIGKIPFKDNEADEALDVGGMSITPLSSAALNGRQNRIAGIWLAPWEGAAGGEPKKDSAPAPTIHLANGDEFTGAIGKFTAEIVTVNSEAGPLDLPAQRLAWIHFPGVAADETKHFPHLRFHDRGLLSVQDLRVENDRLKCKTMQGQAIEFPLSLVKEVVWRPQEEKPTDGNSPSLLLRNK